MKQKTSICKYVAYLLMIAIFVSGFAAAPAVTAQAKSVGVVTANTLYMRTGPGLEYENVTYADGTYVILKKDQTVTILKRVEGSDRDWYNVSVEIDGTTYEGYSAAEYIQELEDVEVSEVTPEATATPTPEAENTDTKESKYDYEIPGIVTASVLTLRKGAGTSKEKITTLPRDAQVTIIGTKMLSKSKQRWYQVLTEVDGKTLEGYVLSDYVKLTLDSGVKATIKQADVRPYKKATLSAKRVKDKSKKVIVLDKKTSVTIIKEVTVDGVKWFRIKYKYNGKTYKGYVMADMIKFASQTATVTVADPTPTPDPQPAEELPDVTPTINPELDMDGANAIIKDAAALAVKLSPAYSSGAVMTADGTPVLLYSGQAVEVVDVSVTGNVTWCYVRFNYNQTEYFGYINAAYIEGDSSLGLMSNETVVTQDNSDFAAKLERENFPASYRALLVQLHEQYPNWQFEAYHTGLDWNDVIDNESTVGKNLIPNSKSVEWKSLESGAYSWKTDNFVVFDGSTWVTASREAVEYYMDPRNYLTPEGIFQFEVLTYNPSYQTISGVENILYNTAMYGSSYTYPDELGNSRNISYGETFMMAAEYSGVSPFHLASRVKQEVTLGTTELSNSVSGTVAGLEGLYNFFNIGASHSTVAGGNIANGLRYAQSGSASASLNQSCLIPWDNRFKSIVGGAYYIGYNYINRGQNTIYLQKFNVTPTDAYYHQYMANVEAPYAESKKVYSAYSDLESLPIVFSIPVYLNMPETLSPVPQKAYNPNNWLKKLKLSDANGNELSLTPTFSYTKDQEYSLIVDGNTDLINIKTTTVSSLATVISANQAVLNMGYNVVTVQVLAENGDIREYVINIVRDENYTGTTDDGTQANSDDTENTDDTTDDTVTEVVGTPTV